MADQAEITAFGESEADLGSLCHIRRTRSPLFFTSIVARHRLRVGGLAKNESVNRSRDADPWPTPTVRGRKPAEIREVRSSCPELSCYF